MALPVVVLLQCCSAPPDDVPAYKPPRARDDEVSLSVDESLSVCRSLLYCTTLYSVPCVCVFGEKSQVAALRTKMTARVEPARKTPQEGQETEGTARRCSVD